MYYRFEIPKSSGGVRVIDAPDPELKEAQRQLLASLQQRYKLSIFAHGFVKGRSILSNAKLHCGKKYVLNMDIKDFFPTCNRGMLGRIGLSQEEKVVVTRNTSLPQGAPTSPFLSNVVMKEFDCKVVWTLRKFYSDDIRYTRYADDMTFSSNSRAILGPKTVSHIMEILRKHGFVINSEKTRGCSNSNRQNVTGLNINSGRPTVPKAYRKQVRAILHRAGQQDDYCMTEAQKQKLSGMIGHIALCHPSEAKRYRRQLEGIATVKLGGRLFRKLIKLQTRGGGRKAKEEISVVTTSPIKGRNFDIKEDF